MGGILYQAVGSALDVPLMSPLVILAAALFFLWVGKVEPRSGAFSPDKLVWEVKNESKRSLRSAKPWWR